MTSDNRTFTLSIVVPVYNEAAGLEQFHQSLITVLKDIKAESYEVIYCDDGSGDDTASVVHVLHHADNHIKLVKLSRNFGKENALTAGIAQASSDIIITLDGDGQHPVELLPEFIEAWQNGAQVVIGIREENQGEGLFKRVGSRLFYAIFNRLAGQQLVAGSSDYRLIDREVQQEFLRLKESDRITRGLIDWLGFERSYIHFKANARQTAVAGYSPSKLIKLAVNSFVSLSPTPLYIFGYLGVFITCSSLLLGVAVFVEQLLLADPLGWNFTGTAMLSILLLFLIGVVLLSQGMLSLYISHMHSQTKQRPIYVINRRQSIGIERSVDD